jgi:hypothetical protein
MEAPLLFSMPTLSPEQPFIDKCSLDVWLRTPGRAGESLSAEVFKLRILTLFEVLPERVPY